MKNRLIPYPFQNNINALDPQDQLSCLKGLIDASEADYVTMPTPKNLDEWIIRTMGKTTLQFCNKN